MSDAEIINYYANLLILQYVGKPKAFAMIQAIATMAVMNQLPTQVQAAYNIDTAVGVQLNVLGKYVGVSRNQYNFTGPVTLTDDEYRQLIKIQIVQNNSGSSLATIQDLLHTYFAGAINVFDYQDMTLDYFFDTAVGTNNLAEVFIKGGFLPRPMGVKLRATVIAPDGKAFFGFRTYFGDAFNSTTFNTYANYNTTWNWLSFKDIIV